MLEWIISVVTRGESFQYDRSHTAKAVGLRYLIRVMSDVNCVRR